MARLRQKYRWGDRSTREYKTLHKDLKRILDLAILVTDVDFGIVEGHRSASRQMELYKMGRTQIDGVKNRSNHNYNPSRAFDIVAVPSDNKGARYDVAYDIGHLSYLAGVLVTISKVLYMKGEISHILRWGNNWDRDGILGFDQGFDDFPHFELATPRDSELDLGQ